MSSLNIEFELLKNIAVSYVKYPDTFLIGLARVGGLIAILRIGFFLGILNKYLFHKALVKDAQAYSCDRDPPVSSHEKSHISFSNTYEGR